jgi:hypothetical protein
MGYVNIIMNLEGRCFNALLRHFKEREISIKSTVYRPRFLLIASYLSVATVAQKLLHIYANL